MPKFRVGTYKRLSGTVNPINYERIEYKHQIEYTNGVVLIMQHGWYTFTANILGPYRDSKKKIHIWLLVDNVGVAHGFRYIRFLTTYLVKERVFKLHFLSLGGTTSITYTQYFNKFQLVQVKKSEGLNRANPHDDYFEGRMIL